MARHLLVTNDYLPKTGGIQVYLHELWSRLEPGRAVVLTASSHRDAAAFDEASDVVIERVKTPTLILPSPRTLAAIEAAIDRHQPDLVLLDPAWPLGLLGPRLSRPYGVVLHGAEVTIPGRLPLVASSLRYVLRHAAVAVSAGSYPEAEARRNAAEWMPPTINVAPGVDTERFVPGDPLLREAVRTTLGLSPSALLVSSYSRLVPRKGMDTLIRASALLVDSFPTLQVAIGGAGRDRERLEKLAKKLHSPVVFLGRVSDEDLPTWLAASDLMVMDCRSRWAGLEQEGFGIVFLEAAASGVAQVAGRSGGSHEAVHHGVTGLVVANPRSPRDLAASIAQLLEDDSLRSEFAHHARNVAVEQFDWRVLAQRLGSGLAAFDNGATSPVA
ncbi:MAG: glycosyltransferase family 4 protein [Acidimicrobiaceae bacterium]|nr:glycosyltransferase family 4 protein [Acidimicrobiaceae bacterium]